MHASFTSQHPAAVSEEYTPSKAATVPPAAAALMVNQPILAPMSTTNGLTRRHVAGVERSAADAGTGARITYSNSCISCVDPGVKRLQTHSVCNVWTCCELRAAAGEHGIPRQSQLTSAAAIIRPAPWLQAGGSAYRTLPVTLRAPQVVGNNVVLGVHLGYDEWGTWGKNTPAPTSRHIHCSTAECSDGCGKDPVSASSTGPTAALGPTLKLPPTMSDGGACSPSW